MSIFKLAFRNVRKSFRDYGIYFLTVMLGVALFYIFNSLESQSVMMDLNQDARMSLMGVSRIMEWVSGFVASVLGFLIVYANAFLIRRRKKELGVYMVLGMKKGKIFSVLLAETFLVGLLSLAIGLLLGVFLSQGMAVITAKLFGVSVKHFAFVFAPGALLKSVRYFGISFLIVALFNVVNLNRQKLLNLIYAEKRTLQFHRIPMTVSIILFIVSVAMIGSAYRLMLTTGILAFFDVSKSYALLISVILGIVGTLLFFFSLSGFLLRLISKIKGVYFKGLNIFTLKQLSSKMHTAFLSQTFVCLMLFLAISAISVGSSMSSALSDNPRETAASVAIAYLAFYLGMVFLLTCASLLAITQLSEASDNQARYKLLGKLGAPAKMLSKSLFTQIMVYFLLPMVLAIAHAYIAIRVSSVLVAVMGSVDIFATSLTAGGLLVLIYGGYFFVTYRNARKMIR